MKTIRIGEMLKQQPVEIGYGAIINDAPHIDRAIWDGNRGIL